MVLLEFIIVIDDGDGTVAQDPQNENFSAVEVGAIFATIDDKLKPIAHTWAKVNNWNFVYEIFWTQENYNWLLVKAQL